MPPRIALIEATRDKMWEEVYIIIKNISGANFCHVDKKKQEIQFIEDITDGYQKWNGANPSLINSLSIRISEDIGASMNEYHIL
jgi:hypothetical protein